MTDATQGNAEDRARRVAGEALDQARLAADLVKEYREENLRLVGTLQMIVRLGRENAQSSKIADLAQSALDDARAGRKGASPG